MKLKVPTKALVGLDVSEFVENVVHVLKSEDRWRITLAEATPDTEIRA